MKLDQTARPGVIRNVQVLRGVAALLVVFVHIDKLLPKIGLVSFGGGGVDIFFVISGFIMVYTTETRPVTPWLFMRDRIARIVPIYWVITGVVFGLVLIAPMLFHGTHADWLELVKSLLFIPFIKVDGLFRPVLFVGWSLNYEMFFYVLFAVSLVAGNKRWGAISIIGCLVGLVIIGQWQQPQNDLERFYTDAVIIDFALGIGLGLWYRSIPTTASRGTRLIVALTGVLAFAAIVVLPDHFADLPRFVSGAIPATLIVACGLVLERWGWVITSRWGLVVGNASYSIYLIHPFVTQVAEKLGMRVPAGLPTVGLIIATFGGICAVGLATHLMVERPLTSATRRLLGTHPTLRVAPTAEKSTG